MKPTHPRWRFWRRGATTLLATVAALSFSGCETTGTSAEPKLTVQSSRAPQRGAAEGRATRTFRLRYVNARTQELIVPRQEPLLNALARQGFVPAARDASPDVLVWVAAIENIHQEVKAGSMVGPPVSGNEDSIRYKNAAAMFGRHRNTLSADRNSGGEAVIDPDGKIIMTGSLGSSIGEDSTEIPRVVQRTVLRKRNVLALWATDTAPPANADDDGELWRVEIMSDSPADAPPPDFDTLVSTAIQHIAQPTDGLREIPMPSHQP